MATQGDQQSHRHLESDLLVEEAVSQNSSNPTTAEHYQSISPQEGLADNILRNSCRKPHSRSHRTPPPEAEEDDNQKNEVHSPARQLEDFPKSSLEDDGPAEKKKSHPRRNGNAPRSSQSPLAREPPERDFPSPDRPFAGIVFSHITIPCQS